MMRGYAETTGCRRQFLLGYFGEQLRDPCGNCDTCDAGTAEDRGPAAGGFELNSGVRHPEWGSGVVMSSEQDRITVLFDQVGLQDPRPRGGRTQQPAHPGRGGMTDLACSTIRCPQAPNGDLLTALGTL